MRIRTIKPEFWQDERLSELPEFVHMLAAALLNYADDEGYFNANPELIKAACFPLRKHSVRIHGALTELSNIGYIRLAKGVDGRTYGHIVNFKKHQVINRPSPSRIKELCRFNEDSLNNHGTFNEHSLPEQGMEQGMEMEHGKDVCVEMKSSRTPPTSNVSSPVLVFPCDGEPNTWELTESQLQQWITLYPALDILAECRKALAWVSTSHHQRKTSRGMPKFLVSWLNRSQDSGGRSRNAPASPQRLLAVTPLPEDDGWDEAHGFK